MGFFLDFSRSKHTVFQSDQCTIHSHLQEYQLYFFIAWFILEQERIHLWTNLTQNHQSTQSFPDCRVSFVLIILCLISTGISFNCSCEKHQNWCVFLFCFEWIWWYFSFSENTYKSRGRFSYLFRGWESWLRNNSGQKWILTSVLFLAGHDFGKELEQVWEVIKKQLAFWA